MKRVITSILTCLSLGAFAQSTGMEFDGTDDFITTEYDSYTATGSKTVEAWIKATYDSQQRFIVDMGGLGSPGSRFSFKINPGDNNIRIEIGGGGLTGVVNITDNAWHHVAVTYDASATTNKYKLYVDGALDTQGDISTPLNLTTTGGAVLIGARTDSSSTTMFDGNIDEVRIYDEVRTMADIQASMNNELCILPSSLKAYYKLNDGVDGADNSSITSVYDEVTPLSLNAISAGFSLTGTTSNFTQGNVGAAISANAITVTSCGDYTSPDNNVYTVSGIYTDTIAGAFCDSVITIDLTIPTFDLNVNTIGSDLIAAQGAVSYQWLDCDNGNAAITGETNQSFTPSADGNYSVVLIDGACSDTSACVNYTTGGGATIQFNNTALNFDGNNDYIQTNYGGISGDNARTVEAWIRTTELTDGNQQVILDYGNTGTGQRFTFNVLQNNSVRLEVAGNGVVGTTAVNDGNWHHVAATYDPNDNDTVRIYIDGVEDAKKYISIVNTGTLNDVQIGRRQDNTGYFTGDIDEVRIWDVAKTQAEIQASMNNEICATDANLVAYFPMNEGTPNADNTSISYLYDYSGNGNHGEFMNLELTGTASNYIAGAPITSGINASITSVDACLDYTWAENSTLYTTSGVHMATSVNANGCDSLIFLDLTVNQPDNTTETVATCGTYTWAADGMTYSATGTYSAVLTNINGCDSTVTLDLTIGTPNSGTDVVTACNSYTWIDGVTYTTSNNTATHTLTNVAGCDSVVTLDLTIHNSNTITETVANCGIYTWSANGQSYFQSGTYTETLTNIFGCDSVVTLDLTINLDYTYTDDIVACDTYTWAVNGMTYTQTTSVTETFQSQAGCDSIHVLNLTVNASAATTETLESCGTYTWAANGMDYAATGIYTETLQTVTGCDSVVTLDLTVIDLNNGATDNLDGTFSADDMDVNTTYQWLDCNDNMSVIAGETAQNFTPTVNGSYAVEVTNASCVDTSVCIIIDNVGLEDHHDLAFSLYPNPTTGSFKLLLPELMEGTVVVTNVQGQIVLTHSFATSTEVTIDLQGASKGVYFVNIHAQQGTAVQRVVVE